MNLKKPLALIIFFILILPSISLNALSQEEEQDTSSSKTIIDRFLEWRFKIGTKTAGLSRWAVVQFKPPTPIQAYPETVNLEYLNETTIVIGGKNPDNPDEWDVLVNVSGGWNWGWMSLSISYTFEFVPPDDAPEDVWIVNFDPKTITVYPNRNDMNWPGWDTPFKTNLTIKLNPSADPYYPTQDVNIKINVIREETSPNVLTYLIPPSFPLTHTEEYLEKAPKSKQGTYYWYPPTKYLLWFQIGPTLVLKNLQAIPYDRKVENVVDILVKVKKDHYAEIISPPPLEIHPYEVMSIPVTIKNLGNHNDTFNFRVSTTDKNMIIAAPPAITLEPGEEDQALIGVAAPRTFRSVGDVSSIYLEAYSIDDPENVFKNTITLITTGVHFSGGNIYSGVLIFIILLIVAVFLLLLLKKRRGKMSKKPDKPWDIPEEKEYLEKLKKKDKKKYNEVLKMMNDEYESARLWHQYYNDAILKKKREQRQKELSKRRKERSKTKEKVRKEKKEEKLKLKEKVRKEREEILKRREEIKEEKKREPEPVEEEPEVKEVEKPVLIDEKAEAEKLRKERALLTIKREQEKQRRKLSR